MQSNKITTDAIKKLSNLNLSLPTSWLKNEHYGKATSSLTWEQKMNREMSESVSSLGYDSSYDMLDDISELDSDGRETASIASTEYTGEEEQVENFSEQDITDYAVERVGNASEAGDYVDAEQEHAQMEQHMQEIDEVLSSNASLNTYDETPRQSTLRMPSPLANDTKLFPSNDTKIIPAITNAKILTSDYKQEQDFKSFGEIARAETYNILTFLGDMLQFQPGRLASSLLIAATSALVIASMLTLFYPSSIIDTKITTHVNELNALSEALHGLPMPLLARTTWNVTHLLPEEVVVGRTMFGTDLYGTTDIRYQAAAPYLVFALPRSSTHYSAKPEEVHAYRGVQELEANITRLAEGIYAIGLDPREVHGHISYSISCVKPQLIVSLSHDFGHRLLNSYSRAQAQIGTDLSLAFHKDVAIVREVTEKVQKKFQKSVPPAVDTIKEKSLVAVQQAMNDVAAAAADMNALRKDMIGNIGPQVEHAHKHMQELAQKHMQIIEDKLVQDIQSLQENAISAFTSSFSNAVNSVSNVISDIKSFSPAKFFKDPLVNSHKRAAAIMNAFEQRVKVHKLEDLPAEVQRDIQDAIHDAKEMMRDAQSATKELRELQNVMSKLPHHTVKQSDGDEL